MHQEHQFIERIRQNDPTVMSDIYKKYAEKAKKWLIKNGCNKEEAKDIFQDTIFTLLRTAAQPTFVLTCPMGGFLFVIYSRLRVNAFRKKNRDERVREKQQDVFIEEIPYDMMVEAELAMEKAKYFEKMQTSMHQLSDTCQKLLEMDLQGKTTEEIMATLHFNSENTLYRRRNACKQRLHDLFFKE